MRNRDESDGERVYRSFRNEIDDCKPRNPGIAQLKTSTSKPRVILRIDVTPRAVQEHRRTTEDFGMTQVAVTSRLLLWFFKQPDVIQARILGIHPEGVEDNPSSLTVLVMRQMTNSSETRI